ncbi:MAG TPA: hypothetical protein VIH00_03535 [Candidatus Limnocylindrales bacterium]
MPKPRGLPPDHHCRTDDMAYENVTAWYEDHVGRVPIQMAHSLSVYIRKHDCTFAEAYQALIDRGAIILLDDEPETTPSDPADG